MRRLAIPFWNGDERRLRALWRLLIQALMLGVAATVFAYAVRRVEDTPANNVLLGLGAIVILIGTVLLAGRWLDRRRLADFGMRIDRAWLLDCAFGMALGLVMMGAIVAVGVAAGWMEIRPAPRSAGVVMMLAVAFLEFVLVALGEELLVRGYHLRNIAEGLRGRFVGPRVAIVIATVLSALVFCMLHLPGSSAPAVGVASLFLAGLLLATGFVYTGRLGLPIGLHLTWNFAEGCVFGFAVSGNTPHVSMLSVVDRGPALWTGGDFGPEGGLLSVFAIIAGIVLTMAWVRVRYGPPRLDVRLAEYGGRACHGQLACP